MERIKLLSLAALIMCCSIFVSTFFYLEPLSSDDVYLHMDKEIKEVFDEIEIPMDTSIITKEEFLQPISNEVIKERVQAMFDLAEEDSIYSYGEETTNEFSDNIIAIYNKEQQRLEKGEAQRNLLWIQILSGSGCIIIGAIYLILYKKRKLLISTDSKKEEKIKERKESEIVVNDHKKTEGNKEKQKDVKEIKDKETGKDFKIEAGKEKEAFINNHEDAK